MKRIILMLFFLFIIKSEIFSQNDSIINWNERSKISWLDFKIKKGFDSRKQKIYNASSSVGIKVNYKIDKSNNNYIITVKAKFYKYESTSSLKTDELLEHEQLHFDIVELFARKLRKKYYENYDKLSKEIIGSLYYENRKLLNEYQDLYDEETKHSEIIEKQIEWNNKVKRGLDKLESFNFKNYNLKMNL